MAHIDSDVVEKELSSIPEGTPQEESNVKPLVEERTDTEPLKSCKLLFPSWATKIKRQWRSPKIDKGVRESSLAPLGMDAVADWT